MFDGIKMRRLRRPSRHLDLSVLESFLDSPVGELGIVILWEDYLIGLDIVILDRIDELVTQSVGRNKSGRSS